MLPAFAGVPAAAIVLLVFVVEPLRPLEPREVCERFLQAKSESAIKGYATLNLLPAMRALARLNDNPKAELEWELTDDGPAPPDVGGYFVGFRMLLTEGGRPMREEGVFHLVMRDSQWKIEEVYFTSINDQSLNPWITLSRDGVKVIGGVLLVLAIVMVRFGRQLREFFVPNTAESQRPT